ncbi:MAG: LysR family transcriptional regulator [Vulcanimicrobiaceae bacterium]
MDLNLIRPLCALLEERHVSNAAERCGVTQPAMSRMLDRLRTTFGDELLVRSGRRYERTPRAELLLAEMRDLLARVDAAVAGDRFEPARSEAVFRVATTDYIAAVLVPALLRDLEARAPLASLELSRSDERTLDDVATGRVDLALLSVGEPSPALASEPLFTDDYVCVIAAHHPLRAKRRLTLAEFLAHRHVVIDVEHGLQPTIDQPLHRRGERRRVGYRTPFLTAALAAVAATSMVLTVPRRLVESHAGDAALRQCGAPPEFASFTYALTWHRRLEASAAHAWFLERIRAVGAGGSLSGRSGR